MKSDKIEQMNKNKEMSEFNEDSFCEELSSLLQKYNLKNCIFAGENEDDKMIGLFCIEKYKQGHSLRDLTSTFSNAARMYQATREHVLKMMDGK
jgi:hypothetical protein